MTDRRVSRAHAEALVALSPDRRVSREHVEALVVIAPDRRVSREHVEVLYHTRQTVDLAGTITGVTADFALAFPSNVSLAGTIAGVTGDFQFSLAVESFVQLAGEVSVTGDFTVAETALSDWAETLLDIAATDLMFWARHADGEGSGVLYDSSGNGRHGVIAPGPNGPHEATALVGDGKAVNWGGDILHPEDGGTADVPDGGWFDPSGGLTIGTWVNMTPFGAGHQQRILDKVGTFSARIAAGTPNNSVSVSFAGGVGGLATFLPGRHLLVMTIDSTAVLTGPGGGDALGYLDAVQFYSEGPTTALAVDAAKPLTFGYQTGSPEPVIGVQDETFIIGRAITAAEVRELFAAVPSDVALSGTIPAVTGAFTTALSPMLTLAGTITRPTGAFTVQQRLDVTLAGTIAGVTSTFSMAKTDTLTLDGTIATVTGAFTMRAGEVSLAGSQQRVMGSFGILTETTLSLAGAVPGVTADFTLTGSFQLSLAGEIPGVTSVFLISSSPQTETGNRASGRNRSGLGYVFYEPPVVAAPDFDIAQHSFVTVRAYTTVDITTGRAVVTSPVRAQARRTRDRVVVGGKDVTFFRGVATPAASYTLVAPLLYGPATLELPQVAAAFEAPGVGALFWCRKGAKVLVQRVDPDTNEVVATDYKGVVVAHDISGRTLQLQIGGEASGRAALIDKQPPLFFKRNDLGFWWWGAVQDLGLPFEPRLGIDTGIVLRNAGGMSHLDYMQDLSAKGTRRNGAQLTCMPDRHEDGGAYRVVTKDLETVRGTVYLDDTVTVPDLRDDLAEQPNRVFATGVTPEGMRVKFGAYPVLRDDTPPPYPMSDMAHFGTGTTDGDTDTGDGVSVMIWRLVKTGYLPLADKPGGFDDEVADAIKDLKADALDGPTFIDGDMTPQAWAALFDASATGYSLAGTQILPAAQASRTRKWNRTANGSVIARNTDYDPTLLPVDATIDAGVGMTRRQIRGFARGELTPVGDAHFVGTITLNSGAVIDGVHNPGDPLTEADVLDARDLRPGENLWAPLFAGGTLFHIAGVDRRVNDQGVTTVVLDVDTQARDTMKVWEVIRRNRDSRRNPARAWLNQHRSSALTKDSVVEFDEIGGVLDDRVDLAGGAWTVFPIVAGQEGMIRNLRLETMPQTEFVTAVFGRQVNAAALASLIGNPLTKHGKHRWVREDIRAQLDEDHVLLYTAGEKQAPCGYFPGVKFPDGTTVDESGDDDTDEPDAVLLTGRWEDDAGFSYHTFSAPVLWVAVFAAEASHLLPGRVMWPQLEAGS